MFNNDNLRRAENLAKKIAHIEKIIQKGEYVGAGITLSINVGPLQIDESPELTLEISSPELMTKLLNDLSKELAERRTYWRKAAHKEMAELQDYFKSH